MRRLTLLLAAGLLVLLAALWWVARPGQVASLPATDRTPDLGRGETLFLVGGCANCHAAPDAEYSARPLLSGGLALRTAFGEFLVPNISPHPRAGIGQWSETDFVNAMTFGSSPDGRHYYPAFPYTSYRNLSLPDLRDLYAWLMQLPASDRPNEPHRLSWPWSVRAGIGLWKWRYLESPAWQENPQGDVTLANQGEYLVAGAGHCGECHTPRDRWGGWLAGRWLDGADNATGDGRVPGLRPVDGQLGDWSEGDIAFYLESGLTPDWDTAGGEMVAVQENLARVDAGIREAIAAYLASLPAEKQVEAD